MPNLIPTKEEPVEFAIKRRRTDDYDAWKSEHESSLLDDVEALLACVESTASPATFSNNVERPRACDTLIDLPVNSTCSENSCMQSAHRPEKPPRKALVSGISAISTSENGLRLSKQHPSTVCGLFVTLSLHRGGKMDNNFSQILKFYCDAEHLVKIGRGSHNDVRIGIGSASWFHAELFAIFDGVSKKVQLAIRDISTNGTGLQLPGAAWQRLAKGADTLVPDGTVIVLPWKKKDQGGQLYYTVNVTSYDGTQYVAPTCSDGTNGYTDAAHVSQGLEESASEDSMYGAALISTMETVMREQESEAQAQAVHQEQVADANSEVDEYCSHEEEFDMSTPARVAMTDAYLQEEVADAQDFVSLMKRCTDQDTRVKFLEALDLPNDMLELSRIGCVEQLISWMQQSLEDGADSEALLLKAFDLFESLPPSSEIGSDLQSRLRRICSEIQVQYPDVCAQELLRKWDLRAASTTSEALQIWEVDPNTHRAELPSEQVEEAEFEIVDTDDEGSEDNNSARSCARNQVALALSMQRSKAAPCQAPAKQDINNLPPSMPDLTLEPPPPLPAALKQIPLPPLRSLQQNAACGDLPWFRPRLPPTAPALAPLSALPPAITQLQAVPPSPAAALTPAQRVQSEGKPATSKSAPALPPWRRPGSWLHAKMLAELQLSSSRGGLDGAAAKLSVTPKDDPRSTQPLSVAQEEEAEFEIVDIDDDE